MIASRAVVAEGQFSAAHYAQRKRYTHGRDWFLLEVYMGTINVRRVIAGGLLAGLVINAFEFAVNGVWLAKQWEAAMQALGKASATGAAQIVVYNVWGFVMGVFAVWVYAAIRPRFGPGPKTAAVAALAAWLPGYLLSLIPPAVMGMFPMQLMVISAAVGLVEVLLGTELGAYLYREETPSPA